MTPATEPISAVKLALLAKQLRERLDDELLAADPIAIVGMACRFPGGADTPEALWDLIRDGGDAITTVPPDRWDVDAIYDTDASVPGTTSSRFGGFLDGVDRFDAGYFGISPREAAHMDPQQRLVLEVAVEALERSGLPIDGLAGSLTGVFMASTLHDYGDRYAGHLRDIDAHTLTGNAHCIIPNRLSFLYDLRGPSVAVDTACSSSLVAVHLACQSLRSRDSDLALAGGVNVMLLPDTFVALSRWGLMARDGRCKTFDSRADGFVRSEGCGVVVLKRLADAIADNDPVVGVIRGTATNQDGRSTAMSAPNGLAQQDVVRRALRDGRVDPAFVGCVEAHGTGTILGDPIEVEALGAVLGAPTDGAPPLALTAVKANIGHLEAAAGVAGLIKAVLCLRNEQVPAAPHFVELNPHIRLDGTRLFIPTEPHAWPRGARPRFAGVSSFGFGGTNAHVVLEEAPVLPVAPIAEAAHLLVVSAQQPDALRAAAGRLADTLAAGADPAEVCAAAARRRTHHDERLAVVGGAAADLVDRLRLVADGGRHPAAVTGRRRGGARRRVAFVFSGQGTQWWGMARDLLDADATFREALEAVDAALQTRTGWSVIEELTAAEADARLDQTIVAQPVIFAVQVALAARWRAWGISPDAVVGHSVGEVAAAHVAGALTLEQAVAVIVDRARFMQAATGNGTMAAVARPAGELAELVARSGGALSIAAMNAPAATVLAGELAAMDAAVVELRGSGADVQQLAVDYAFHSRQMAPHADALAASLTDIGLEPTPTRVRMVSTVTGSTIDGVRLDAAYWARNVAEPVRFQAAVEALAAEGVDVFLEIGAHPVLGGAVRETLRASGDAPIVAASLRRGRADAEALLLGLGQLHVAGVEADWGAVFPGRRRPVDLPTYPWQRERHWYDVIGTTPAACRPAQGGSLLGRRVRSAAIEGALYELELAAHDPAFLADHRIGDIVVVPATAYLAMAAASFADWVGMQATRLADIDVLEALALGTDDRPTTVQVHLVGDATSARFTVTALGADETWTVHARGVVSAAASGSDDHATLDVEAIRERAVRSTAGADLYAGFAARDVRFGPAFRLVDSVWTGAGEALGALAEQPAPEPEPFHPAVLDAAIHPVDTLLPGSGSMYLPVAVREMRVHGSLRGRLWSHVHVTDEDAQTLTIDVTVLGGDGAAVAELIGVRAVRTSAAAVAGLVGRDPAGTSVPLHTVGWSASPLAARAVPAAGPWLIVADRGGLGAALAGALQERGAACTVVEGHVELSREAVDDTLATTRARDVVYLRGLDIPAPGAPDAVHDQELGLGGALVTAQALAATGEPTRLWLVTRGAQAVAGPVTAPEQATLTGLAAAVRAEAAGPTCVTIDLDPAAAAGDATALADTVLAAADDEDLVAWRAGERLVARLLPVDPVPAAGGPSRLVVPAPGILDELRLAPLTRRAPGPGEVEVEVHVTGLNFRDVLIGLDMYPERVTDLGDECSGVVARVGPGVDSLHVGQRVVAAAPGSFASHVTTAADLVLGIPDALGFDEAATIPIAFVTAHLCLGELGRLAPGERVLIHAGAGGVGMAAIQLAQRVGAEVLATAGSEAKRDLLRASGVRHVFDSRSLDFAAGVMDATGGDGVHVVLNSLAGDFIPRSLDVLAPGGRFLEIGRRDTWEAEEVAAVRPDVDYRVVFVGDLRRTDPAAIQALLRQLLPRFESGELAPLPSTAFELDDVVDAFRLMARSGHTGKIVVRQPQVAPPIRPDATYLVTGGGGGVGIALARHLVDLGARHVALLGRRAPDASTIDALAAGGAQVVGLAADVADRQSIAAALSTIARDLPPLRGIVHAAGVLADASLANANWPAMANVLAPKVAGARHLDELTADLALDFVVLCSAAGSWLGAPGQAGYAAANAYLDAFAAHRSARGRPTTAISWGWWDRVGMTAGLDRQAERRMTRRGLLPLTPAQGCSAFDSALAAFAHRGTAQLVAVRLDPGALEARPFLAEVAIAPPQDAASVAPLVDSWAATPPRMRRAAIAAFVLQHARTVLGLPAGAAVDPRQPFQELGLDSLMAVELRNAIGAALGRPQPATLLFDHPTSDALVDRLLREVERDAPVAPLDGDAPANDAGTDVAAIAALSDAEAEALLLAELGGGDT